SSPLIMALRGVAHCLISEKGSRHGSSPRTVELWQGAGGHGAPLDPKKCYREVLEQRVGAMLRRRRGLKEPGGSTASPGTSSSGLDDGAGLRQPESQRLFVPGPRGRLGRRKAEAGGFLLPGVGDCRGDEGRKIRRGNAALDL